MDQQRRYRVAWLTGALGAGLLAMGLLRWSAMQTNALTQWAGLATPGYVLITAAVAIALMRAGLLLNGLGFATRLNLRHVGWAIAAVTVLQLFDYTLNPLIEVFVGGARDLERFAAVKGSGRSLGSLLAVSWTLAAFGEELAYRIVLMRGIEFALGDARRGRVVALVVQAVVFGVAHAYQGPAGIVGSACSGLVFGAVTIAGRRAIWPAALAHGANNTIGIVQIYLG